VKANKAMAAACYVKAAEWRETRAMMSLMGMYKSGEGLQKDWGKEYGWCRKAASAGLGEAMLGVAEMLESC
jgi:TPR repeat protein